MTSHIGTGHFTKRSDFYRGGILENDLGERQQCSYRERGSCRTKAKLGRSLALPLKPWEVVFSLPLDLEVSSKK